MQTTDHRGRGDVRLVPSPAHSAEDAERFRHLDLRTLTARQLWAEAVVIEHDIAQRTFRRQRPRLIDAASGMTDDAWLWERRSRLQVRLSAIKRGAA